MRRIAAVLLAVLLVGSAAAAPIPQTTPECPEPLPVSAGSEVSIRGGVYVRAAPGPSNAIVNYVESFTLALITDGPTCVNGVIWWRVAGLPGEAGWVAQSAVDLQLVIPGPPDEALACPPALNLVPGSRLPLVSGGVRIRAEPNLAGRVLTVALIDTPVTVLAGPECADRLNWWRVQVPLGDILVEGWMAEGFENAPFVAVTPVRSLEAGTLCANPLRLPPGTRAAVSAPGGTFRPLRAAPGTDSPALFTLIDGVAFTITGSPVCADNLNWFPVQILSRPEVTGWLAEGGPGAYVIRRIAIEPLR